MKPFETMTTTRLKSALKPILKPLKHHSLTRDKPTKIETILKSSAKRKTAKHRLKFERTIKVLIIEPTSEYCVNVWSATAVGVAHVCIGAVNLGVLHYSVISGDTHATICCFAFHFFSAEAILSLNYANGWSAPMRLKHRKFTHVFLQICGVSCSIAGTILAAMAYDITRKLHGLSGLIAAGLAGVSVVTGIITLLGKRSWLLICHMSCGIPAFLISSLCVCSGLLTKQFRDWAGDVTVYILIAFILFYTTCIVSMSFMKCMSRI